MQSLKFALGSILISLASCMMFINPNISQNDARLVPETYQGQRGLEGSFTIDKRAITMHPGDLVPINIKFAYNNPDVAKIDALFVAFYNPENDALIRVAGKAPVGDEDGMKPEDRKGGSTLSIQLPLKGFDNIDEDQDNSFRVVKMAVYAVELGQNGSWLKYSTDSKLVAFDPAAH